MWITFTILMLIVKESVTNLAGSCNQCFAGNKVACLNETHFATCFKGLQTATITECPANRFCTDDVHICRTSAEGYTPICHRIDYCGECEPTNGSFTCLDETTYGNCYGGTAPLESSFRSCPQGYVCNYSNREICVPADTNVPSCRNKTTGTTTITSETTTDTTNIEQTTTTHAMSVANTTQIPFLNTSTEMTTTTRNEQRQTLTETTTGIVTTPVTTTQPEGRDATAVCGELQRTGYFQSNDPTCRQYLYCYLLSGQYLGLFYYCDGYFNAATQQCQTERPLNCVEYSSADEF